MFNCPEDKECSQKCQLCEEHPATGTITNKFNGKVLRICSECAELFDKAKK